MKKKKEWLAAKAECFVLAPGSVHHVQAGIASHPIIGGAMSGISSNFLLLTTFNRHIVGICSSVQV